ncbi:MAG TPA: hypothetical protein PLG21_12750, partial [Anaerolineae bacterium]|nr:hypothetical protein [Anaerolineae bacterium]
MSEAVQPTTLGLWPAVWKLLRLQALITVRGFRRAKTGTKVGLAFAALGIVSIIVFVFVMSFLLLNLLRSPQLVAALPEAAHLAASVPVLIVQAGFLIILMTGFGVLLQALYLAGDMDFLLSAPIPVRAVFVSKLLQAIVPNLALILAVALPVLYGLGASSGYGVLYYPLVLIMLLALALAAAGAASLAVMGVVRVFPARRVAEVLGFVGAVFSIVCSQSGQFARGAVSAGQAATALRLVARLDVAWSPLAWAGRGLVGIGEGHWPAGVGFSVLALGAAGLVFALALTSAERLYYKGWAAMQATQRHKRPARAGSRAAARSLPALGGRFVPRAVVAIVAKDWAMLRRDLRNLSQLVTPIILGAVYALMLLRGGVPHAEPGNAPAWLEQALLSGLAYANIGIALFVGWTLLARLAAMGFSQEGQSYWLLKAAPVSAGQLLAAKFIAAYLPALALSWGFAGVLAILQGRGDPALLLQGRGDPAPTMLGFSLAVVALCLAAACGIFVAFGVAGAKLDWEDPRQMVSGATGCLGALATAVTMVVALALFAAPQIGLALIGWPPLAAQFAGLALGGAFCLACALVPPWLLRGRVPRLG